MLCCVGFTFKAHRANKMAYEILILRKKYTYPTNIIGVFCMKKYINNMIPLYRNNFEIFPRVNGIQNDVSSLLGNSIKSIHEVLAVDSCYELGVSILEV